MRYVMYGAGAIGGAIGARLFEAGNDVVLIARGEHGRVLAERGMRFATPDRTRVLRIPVVAEPAALELRPDDVVFLTMKSQDTVAAADALASVAPPGLHVVCAQNGVDNERVAARRFARVHAMCVRCSASYLEPGTIRAFGAPRMGILDVGGFPSGVDDVDRRIAADFESAVMYAQADPAVMRRKYAKLLTNTNNALEAAGGNAARNSSLRDRVRAEAIAAFRAAGIAFELPDDPRNDLVTLEAIDGAGFEGNSTWQSLARGSDGIEVDALNGEVALLGRLHGVPTPVNATLQRIAHRMLRERISAGSVTVDAIEREVAAYAERVRS
jgi:2-dehydropantoate 2-reductase